MMPFVFAHQGGWDEFLMFAVPVALGWWAIKAAEKRSRRRRSKEPESEAGVFGPDGSPAQDSASRDR